MPPESQELTAEEILNKAFNNCQKLHMCGKIFAFAQDMLHKLNLAKQERVVSMEEYRKYNELITPTREKMPEIQAELKNQNIQLRNDYYTKSNSFKNQIYRLTDKTEISVEDLFNCNISKIPYVKAPSDANNSSATNKKKSVPANANSPKSAPINSSKSAINSQKPAVPYSKNPVSTLKPNVPQKPLTKNSGKKVTFGINNTQPPVTKKTQVNNNNKNTNTAQNGQASSAAFNKNKELIKSVMGKMNRQADDFQSRSKFKPIVNSQKNMIQTMDDLLAEAGALNDNAILSEVKKIRSIISNMAAIVKMQMGKLEKIFETIDTEGLLSRQGDIIKNLNYLQKKYPSLRVSERSALMKVPMPSNFVSDESNWDAIKKRYIELKSLGKDLDRVNSNISNDIRACCQDTEKLVNKQLEKQLKPMIDIYSNRAKTMDNNNMFAIKVLTFIKKLNFTNLDFDKYFNKMVSSVADNHIKKYANNSKVTYNDDYLINFHQKYPKNIHDDSNIDRNTISKGPSNLNSLSFSSRAVSFQKSENKQTNNVADKSNPAAPTPSGSSKSVSKTSSPPVSSADAKAKASGKDNKTLNSGIDWSVSKTSKTLNKLRNKLDPASAAALSKNLSQIEYLKGLAEKIMDEYYEGLNKLYTKKEKRYLELDMQINDINNKYSAWGSINFESIEKPNNFKGTQEEWTKFKFNYKNLNNEFATLYDENRFDMAGLYSKAEDLFNRTKSKIESEVVSKLEETKSDLDKNKSEKIQGDDQKKIVKSIIEYVGSLIKKYSDFSRNVSKTFSIKNDPTKTMWKYQKRGAEEGFNPELDNWGG